MESDLVPIGRCAHTGADELAFVNCLHDPCHRLFILAEETERENTDTRLCPECLATGLTSETADYPRPRSDATLVEQRA